MKALTLSQPWATLVAIEAKKVETRSWSTPYRGLLAIHAAKSFPLDARTWAITSCHCVAALIREGLTFLGCLPRGAIVAVCDLTDCIPIRKPTTWFLDTSVQKHYVDQLSKHPLPPPEPELSFGDYTPGRFAWIPSNVRRFREPIPAKGALGLWEWTPPENWESLLEVK